MSSLPIPTDPAPRETGGREAHLPQLDAVRGIACLLVLVAHLQAVRGMHWMPDKVGTVGVGLFFAMSGFLITRILVADKAAGRGLNAFYNRRAARIFPVYFLLLAVLWLVWPGRELGWAATFTFNLHFLTGAREYFHIDAGRAPVPPVAHVWSLCVEEHYYWLWPTLVWLLPARFYRFLPAVCIAATPFVTAVLIRQLAARGLQPDAIEGLVWRLTPTQLVALSLGACCAIHERRLTAPVRAFGRNWSPFSVLALLLCCVSAAGWVALHAACTPERCLPFEPLLLHLGCGGLLALGLGCQQLGRFRAFNAVGRISYGLYLFHLPVYAWLGLAGSGACVSWWRGAAALALTFVLAAGSFRYFEAPILAWSRRAQHGLRLGWGRLSLSLGAALTAALGLTLAVQAVQWTLAHPRIPRDLRYREVPGVAGSPESPGGGYTWMGVYHCLDGEGFRRSTPIPPKAPGVSRVAVVGDSFAFGQCVVADQVFASVAERLVRRQGAEVEVLNLARCGSQAEDALKIIQGTALVRGADVVVYAATVDDFLPSGQGNDGQITLRMFREQPAYGQRFRAAVRAMRQECEARGVILRVLPFTQQPNQTEVAATIRFIQSLCRAEGVELIDVDGYLRDNAGRGFESYPNVDPHPNAECHRLHGEMVARELLRLRREGRLGPR
jgi:peptidoglycan/LPS O-acetylase OafA/YrhL